MRWERLVPGWLLQSARRLAWTRRVLSRPSHTRGTRPSNPCAQPHGRVEYLRSAEGSDGSAGRQESRPRWRANGRIWWRSVVRNLGLPLRGKSAGCTSIMRLSSDSHPSNLATRRIPLLARQIRGLDLRQASPSGDRDRVLGPVRCGTTTRCNLVRAGNSSAT